MLSILGLVAVIVATYHVYKTARDTGRNAVGWAVATFAVGFGIQIILPIFIGFAIGVVMAVSGSSEMEIQEFAQGIVIIISIAGLLLSFLGIWLIMRRVSKIPDEETFQAPPSPPTFDGK